MNIRAKQIEIIDVSRMDNTTALGFFLQMKNKFLTDTTLTVAMGSVWSTYVAAYAAYDDAYAQTRKWAQTEDITNLDTQRDQALSAYLQALKAMTASPNAAKQQAAKTLAFIRDKYTLNASDEYMKETTAISQMIQEIEDTPDAVTALATTGLDDWLTDLKTKNEAFLAKMNERTEAQAGQQKGIVREKRTACESAYRDVVKLVNAMAICEVPAGYSFVSIIDLLNAEIEHYRQILARKGSSSGDGGGNTPTPTPTPDDQGGGGSDDQGGGDGGDDDGPSGGDGDTSGDDDGPSSGDGDTSGDDDGPSSGEGDNS